MPTHDILITFVIIAAVIFAIGRQIMPQQVHPRRLVIFPLIAAYEAYHVLPSTIPPSQFIECLFVVIAALVAGAVQAILTRVYFKANQLYMRGGWATLVAWLGMFFVRFVIHMLFEGGFSYTRQSEWILWVAIAVTFGTRSLILYMKHPEIQQILGNERSSKRSRRDR